VQHPLDRFSFGSSLPSCIPSGIVATPCHVLPISPRGLRIAGMDSSVHLSRRAIATRHQEAPSWHGASGHRARVPKRTFMDPFGCGIPSGLHTDAVRSMRPRDGPAPDRKSPGHVVSGSDPQSDGQAPDGSMPVESLPVESLPDESLSDESISDEYERDKPVRYEFDPRTKTIPQRGGVLFRSRLLRCAAFLRPAWADRASLPHADGNPSPTRTHHRSRL
jgi:hypothetical protein